MKFRFIGLFIICAATLIITDKAYAQDNFEGKVSMNVYGDDNETHPMEYYIKDGKIRFDAKEKEGTGAFIMDPASKQILIIMPEQKMYLQMKMPEGKMDNETREAVENAEFVKTGETKEILGYNAEKWTYKDDNKEGEVWMTKVLGTFYWFKNPMMKEETKSGWMKELREGGYFPLMVTENGKKVFEVTSVQKAPVDASLFEIPPDYQKMEMPMMQK